MTEEVLSALTADSVEAQTTPRGADALYEAPWAAEERAQSTEMSGDENGAPPAEDGMDIAALPDAPYRHTDASLRSHFDSLCAQGEALRAELPDFSLAAALRDADFLRLTSPMGGVSVRAAWYALHADDIARDAERRVVSSVRSGMLRPREGGEKSAAAQPTGPRALPRAEREELKARIRAAAARGEKLYPTP